MAGGRGGNASGQTTGGGAGGTGYYGLNGTAGTNNGGGGGGAVGYTPTSTTANGSGGTGGGTGAAGGLAGYTPGNQSANGTAGGSGTGNGGGGGGGSGVSGFYAGAGNGGTSGVGGNGGAGGAGSGSGGGGGGGAGGYGGGIFKNAAASFTLGSVGRLKNKTYAGGNGGNGGRGGSGVYGGGGDGGAGFVDLAGGSSASLTVGVGYMVSGGKGGTGGTGGAGGRGIYFADTIAASPPASDTISLSSSGTIKGGTGGQSLSGTGATGGAGATLAVTNNSVASVTVALTNSAGSITGGIGGVSAPGVVGGTGGAGVVFSSAGAAPASVTLTNQATITGGTAGGTGSFAGIGGAGVIGAGLTVLQSGTITGGAGGTQGDAITFTGGGNTLALGGSDATSATNGFSGAIDIKAGTLTFNQLAGSGFAANVTFGDKIIGAGAVTKTDAGTLTLIAANTYTGTTTIFAGTLQLGNGTTNGSVAGTILDYATLTLDPSGSQTVANTIMGSGALNKIGGGTVTLSGSNGYFGSTTISAGTLAVSATSNLGSTSNTLILAGGTLETTAGFTSTRKVTLAGDGTVQVDSGTLTLSGVFGGAAPQFFKIGAGTLVLANAGNTYNSETTIEAGTLSISTDADLGATTGRLDLAGGTLETTAGFTSSARTVGLDASSAILVDAGVTATFSGSISGGGATILTKSGTGTLELSGMINTATAIAAGTLDLAQAPSGAITFAGTSATPATLMLETSAQPDSGGLFAGTLTNFGANDELDLAGFTFSSLDTATVVGDTLTFTDNSNIAAPKTERFTLAGTHDAGYSVHDAGANGIVIDDAPCYVTGTRIRTAHGNVAVEDLAVGDLAVTASGAHRPIRWVGHRTIDPRRHPRPHETQPIRIAAHAFAPDRPARDLGVSPAHAICVDVVGEVLIPAVALVNDSTIAQVEVDTVTYWHVELDSHDVLLAENLPAESYIDMGNRGFFAQADVVALAASPDADAARRTSADYCRPFAAEGPGVAAVRAHLHRRARDLGWRLAEDLAARGAADGLSAPKAKSDRR